MSDWAFQVCFMMLKYCEDSASSIKFAGASQHDAVLSHYNDLQCSQCRQCCDRLFSLCHPKATESTSRSAWLRTWITRTLGVIWADESICFRNSFVHALLFAMQLYCLLVGPCCACWVTVFDMIVTVYHNFLNHHVIFLTASVHTGENLKTTC